MTNRLLAFSRKQVLVPQVLDIKDVIKDLEKMLRRLIGEDINFVTILDLAPGQVKVDPAQVEQLIFNLVVNARDAMPDGGDLIIETFNKDVDAGYAACQVGAKPGRYVGLAVSDRRGPADLRAVCWDYPSAGD